MALLLLVSFSILCNLLIGFFVLYQDHKSKLNRFVAALALSLTFWQIANFLADKTSTITLFWNRAAFIGPMFAFLFASLFVCNLEKLRRVTVQQWCVLAGCIFFTAYTLTDQVIPSVNPRLIDGSIVGYDVTRGSGYLLIISWILYILIYFVLVLHASYREPTNKLREQLNVIVLGLSIALFVGITSNLLIPLITSSTSAARFAPFTSIIIMSTFAFAIAKHGLLDIRFYVIRAATYSLSILTLSFLYVAPVLYIMITILGFPFIPSKFLLALVVASFGAFYYHALRQRFDRITSRIFYKDRYDPELFIAQLNKAVVTNLDLPSMLKSASEIISRNMKAEYCLFTIEDKQTKAIRLFGSQRSMSFSRSLEPVGQYLSHVTTNIVVTDYLPDDKQSLKKLLRKNDIAVYGKLSDEISSTQSLRSNIILGQKKSGDTYNKQDISILETIIDGLIVAVQNAVRFEETQNFNLTLQQQVDDATRQLRRTNAKLVALDETKDDFISMASHQLRTPLTAVKGYLSMVIEGDAGTVTPVQRKMLNQAFMSSQRMVYLIADLLNVSRLKTGKFVIERAPLDLAHLIGEEIGQLREQAASRSVELTFDHPKQFPKLLLDETKTRQVVMNFIDNAIHYTPAGGHISVELRDKPHSVELRVRDDGIGVPKAEQHHLFTKFYRAGNARRERPDGTGLGLFMAKKVVVAQGGAVVFDSRENKGSTFGFTLPKDKLLVKRP